MTYATRSASTTLVLGIVAFLFCWVPFVGLVGLVAGTVGLVRSRAVFRNRTEPYGQAVAGNILSGIAVTVVVVLHTIMGVALAVY